MNPTVPLSAISKHTHCEEGREKLAEARTAGLQRVSLGYIANIYGAKGAFWCVRALDWSDAATRRAVIGNALLPTIKRASKLTTDERVHWCVAEIERWCQGDDTVDLKKARAAASDAASADLKKGRAAYAAACAAHAASDAASAAADGANAASVYDAADAAMNAVAHAAHFLKRTGEQ